MDSFGFHQYVTEPTHDRGHTLDLVFARSEDDCVSRISVTTRISDHHAVECCLSLRAPLRPTKRVSYRPFKSIDLAAFEKDLEDLPLLVDPAATLDGLVAQ